MNDKLSHLKQKARRINKAQKMEANLGMFERLGLDLDDVARMTDSVGLEAEDLLLMETNLRVVIAEPTPEPANDTDDQLPDEVSTEEAARLLGISKDTVLKFKQAGYGEDRRQPRAERDTRVSTAQEPRAGRRQSHQQPAT